MVYLPYWDEVPYRTYFLVRTQQDPALLATAVRNAIWSYNPDVTIARVHTLDSQLSDSLAPEHLQTTIFVAFGAAALLLALLGIYGTLSYAVESRTQEVGIRMALGASRQNIYRLMLTMVLAPVAIGLVLGWAASLAIGRSLTALLYKASPADPSVSIPIILIFALAAILATWVPCRRASRIEPMQALKTE
jgi:ABC-type antimicrobial peptide transport system permease subunit